MKKVTPLERRDTEKIMSVDTFMGSMTLSSSLLKVISSTSHQQCAHRCRRTDGCVQAAIIDQKQCLLMKKKQDQHGNEDEHQEYKIEGASTLLQPMTNPSKISI